MMADTRTSTTNSKGESNADKGADAVGAGEVQATVDAEQEQGFRGVKVDPTPDHHYTVAGVAEGLPTPETDAKAHDEAHNAARLEGRFPTPGDSPARGLRRG
jgi:hypothetical protein